MKIDPYSFILRGLLTESALDNTSRIKNHALSVTLEKETASKLPLSQLDKQYFLNAKKMATVFVAISTFENMMRDFIGRVMTNAVNANWWNLKVPQKLQKKVEDRIANEKKVPWHTQRGNKPINYTDFGDLADLIIALWIHFEQEVQDQGRLKGNFNVIELSRNACMHGGDLSERDIERVGMLIRDWVEQLGLG
jgi:hypothetical protein